jgi:2-polyprenyl-3-methyl-5-hydroxy-6-metoxy-1,4-benzoquinol methylase
MDSPSPIKPYYRNPRQDVLEHLDGPIVRLLDVGCGAGTFGSAVKERDGAEVWGIELNGEMARYAGEKLDRVLVGDVAERLPEVPDGHFDLVSCNDVLEHTVDPGAILRSLPRVLRPNGKVTLSLPNVRYWDALKRVVFDADWPQEDLGIFDRTHLRFFTEKSMRRFIPECGYTIEKMVGLNPTPSRVLRAVNLLTRNRYQDCQFLQYLIVARPNR